MTRFLRKISALTGKIPPRGRRGKLIRNIICILLLCVVVWWCCGLPALSARHAFRRMERAYMLEPSEILAVVPGAGMEIPEGRSWDGRTQDTDDRLFMQQLEATRAFVVGELGDWLLCFGWEEPASSSFGAYRETEWMHITEKTGAVTVLRTAKYQNAGETQGALFFVQTDLPGAHRITLEMRDINDLFLQGDYYINWCSGTGTVQGDGVFVVPVFKTSDAEGTGEGIDGSFDKYEVHVVITNAGGDIIYDKTLIG